MSPIALRARLATGEAPHEAISQCCDDGVELDLGHLLRTKGTHARDQNWLPTKQACEQAAVKWRANFETQVKEGTTRTGSDRRRRMARAVPSTKCVEDTKYHP
jgi:hypothetical protein